MRLLLILLLSGLGLRAEDNLVALFKQAALSHAEQAVPAGTYKVRCLRDPQLPNLPEGQVRIDGVALSKREPVGTFFATLRLRVNGRLAGTVRVDLEGSWTGRVLRTKTAVTRKSVPTPDQLELTEFEGAPPPGALTEWPEGMRLRAPMAAGRILTRADLEPIPLVQAGDRIRLVLTSGGLSIGTEATALSPGVLGDRIRLEVTRRQRPVQAIITGRGEASITWSKG